MFSDGVYMYGVRVYMYDVTVHMYRVRQGIGYTCLGYTCQGYGIPVRVRVYMLG